jgi:diaminohydroxyphosphoribosylaminopyrimidine deaminase/5-amino-6-(5-phosphoribosylamino)uracil reductase
MASAIPTFTADDHRYMARALRLAARGRYTTDPNPRVGCVLVKAGEIVGEGWHERVGEAHAEVHALRQAGDAARGATAYVTLEPCAHHGRTPPCNQALIDAGVARVVVAMLDPNPLVANHGLAAIEAAGIEVASGLLAAEAEALNPGFLKRMRSGLPYVRVKLAMSVDGRTAMASGESQWITGPHARADVHRLRAQSSAVLTGIGTVLADDPSLTVRDFSEPFRPPVRVVLDPAGQLPADAKLRDGAAETWVFTSRAGAKIDPRGVQLEIVAGDETKLELEAVLRKLAELEINEVLVEAGATLAAAFVEQGWSDELVIYQAPVLLGQRARALLALDLDVMADKLALRLVEQRRLGEDWRLRWVHRPD